MNPSKLPWVEPYKSMMAFHHRDKVELSLEAERLMQCPVVVRSWFDVLADEAIILPLDLIVFHYSLPDWERLCQAIREYLVPSAPQVMEEPKPLRCGHGVTWNRGRRPSNPKEKGRPS